MTSASFLERFVLATDRKALLHELTPNSTESYLYAVLVGQLEVMEAAGANPQQPLSAAHRQQLKDLDALISKAYSGPWGSHDRDRMRLRNNLLQFTTLSPSDQKSLVLDEIVRRVGAVFNHTKRVERHEAVRQNLPTALPATFTEPEQVLKDAWSSSRSYVNSAQLGVVKDWAARQTMDRHDVSTFLGQLTRPSVPNLVALVVRDLQENKHTFGAHAIHHQLTAEQLAAVAKAEPAVASQLSFVTAQLKKTQPADLALLDAAERKQFFAATWEYAVKLPAQFNALKTTLMTHVLQFESTELIGAASAKPGAVVGGHYDWDKFAKFIELPRSNHPFTNRFTGSEYKLVTVHWAAAGTSGGILPGLYGADAAVCRDFVRQWIVDHPTDDTPTAKWAKHFEPEWLLQLLAETRLLKDGARVGQPDAARYAEYVNRLGASTVAALKARVDLEFDGRANPKDWATAGGSGGAAEPDVRLHVWVKNVPSVTVKLFRVNARSYYRATWREVDASIDLDGMTAWHETTLQWGTTGTSSSGGGGGSGGSGATDAKAAAAVDPLQRTQRTLEFPQLRGQRGVFVVELLGNGKFTRAVIRKGALSFLEHQSERGHTFRVLDEHSRPVNGASVWIGGHTYHADPKTGLVLAPFAAASKPAEPLLLMTTDPTTGDEFTSLCRFHHMAESYRFAASLYVDRESLLAKAQSEVVIRPALYLNGHPLTNFHRPVKKATLRLTTTNDEGVASSSVVHDFKFAADGKGETVHPFTVPDALRRLEVRLEVELRLSSTGGTQTVTADASYAVNGVDDSERIDDLHLRYGTDGYSVWFLGKAGEARPHVRLSVTLYHAYVTSGRTLRMDLQTDETGRVLLGHLQHVTRVQVTADHSPARGEWTLEPLGNGASYHTFRALVHAQEQELIRLPYFGAATKVSTDHFSLLEQRHGSYQTDLTATHLDLSLEERALVVKNLRAGTYSLQFKELATDHTVTLVVARGDLVMSTYVMERHRFVELRSRDVAALQIGRVTVDDKNVDVQLSQWGLAPRVHVFSSHFVPEHSLADALRAVGGVDPMTTPIARLPSQFCDSRKLGDEHQYILDRKHAKKCTGNMLPRPSLLLNERVRQLTTFDADPTLSSGDPFAPSASSAPVVGGARGGGGPMMRKKGDYYGGGGGYGGLAIGSDPNAGKTTGFAPVGTRNLEFLSDGSTRLLNLVPDATGRVRVARDKLGAHHTHLWVVAVDGHASVVVQRVALAAATSPPSAAMPSYDKADAKDAKDAKAADAKAEGKANALPLHPGYTDTRLLPGLVPGKHYTEQHLISLVAPGETLTVDDIRTSTVETYETLPDVWALYQTLAKDRFGAGSAVTQTLTQFQFLLQWPQLSPEAKSEKYSAYSGHELNFYLYHKDRAFFDATVRPFLRDKLSKTFLDKWLLGGYDLTGYARPHEFGRLNALEQILLAAALPTPALRAACASWNVDRAALAAKDPQHFIRLFKTALASRTLDAAEKGKGSAVPKASREAERDTKKQLAQEYDQQMQSQQSAFGMASAVAASNASLMSSMLGGMPPPPPPAAAPMMMRMMDARHVEEEAAPAPEMDMCDDEADDSDGGGSGSDNDEDRSVKSKKKVAAPMRSMAAGGRALRRAEKEEAAPRERRMMAKVALDEWEGGDSAAGGAPAPPPRRLFQAPPTTKELEERNYWDVPSSDTDAATRLIALNPFWADYAAHVAKTAAGGSAAVPFLSAHLAYPAANFTEMVMALAVLDLPFAAGKHTVAPGRVTFKFQAATSTVLFHRELKETRALPPSIAVTQSYFDPADPFHEERGADGERVDKYLDDEYLVGRVYGCRTVLTNVSSSNQTVALLKQVPAGSIPVTKAGRAGTCRAFLTRTDFVTVASFSTHVLEFFFYFPAAGAFVHYPVHVSKTGKDGTHVIGYGAVRPMRVVGKPTTPPDTASWRWISQNGTDAQVLEYLRTQNLHRVELGDIAFRYRESASFYAAASQLLRDRLVSHPVLLSYALHYNDAAGLRLLLPTYIRTHWLDYLGAYFRSPLLSYDSAADDVNAYQHFEYAPLINARAHQLKTSGGRVAAGAELEAAKIQNVQFRTQYARFLQHLLWRSSCRRALPLRLQLAAVYYLLLQERNDEAVQLFASIARPVRMTGSASSSGGAAAAAPASTDAKAAATAAAKPDGADDDLALQYDYLAAYLDFFSATGPGDAALAIAKRYANYPVLKKRALFTEVADQIFEASPNASPAALDRTVGGDQKTDAARDKEMANLAATEPSFDLTVEDSGASAAATGSGGDAKAASGKSVVLHYANVPSATLNFYAMDLELLFSTNPFLGSSADSKKAGAGGGGDSKLFVSPNHSVRLPALPADKAVASVPLPAQFRNANVFVEAVGPGGGLTRVVPHFSNALAVQVIEPYGQLKVTDRATGRPLPTTYVKVYARHKSDGSVQFYKDGYTDVRGRFDYATLSTSKLPNVARFAVLVLSDRCGAVVREASPPSS